MKSYSLKSLAEALDGEWEGDPDLQIRGIRIPAEAGEGEIGVVLNERVKTPLPPIRASALVVSKGSARLCANWIGVQDTRAALIRLLELFHRPPARRAGIAPGAVVSPQAELGPDVSVAAGVCVEAGARLGARVTLYPNVYVGENTVIGDDTVVFPNVTLYSDTRIGRRVRIHSGAVIGSDGFGYARDAGGVYRKIPQVGGVEIGDDVEIGANCTIDRATLATTRIGRGTKIDNLVQVGHNAEIGKDCCIIAQVGISGSAHIGDSCVLAGQAGVRDHVTLANGVVVGAQAGVIDNLSPGEWVGSPAIPAAKARKVFVLWEQLPELRSQVRALRQRCDHLEQMLERLQNSQPAETARGSDG